MLVTALVPVLGYDRAAEVALHAYRTGGVSRTRPFSRSSTPEEFDRLVDPAAMVGPDD